MDNKDNKLEDISDITENNGAESIDKAEPGDEAVSADQTIKHKMSDLYNDIATLYAVIYAFTRIKINEFFRYNNSQPSFPINYLDFAEWLGIDIIFQDLNYYRSNKFSKILGRLEEEKDGQYRILLDTHQPFISMRYAICHEIAHYFCRVNESFCIQANLPASKDEIIADMIASFLMLPPKLALDKAYEYTKINDFRPVDLNEIFNYLSSEAQLPYYWVVTSYEHLKVLACYLNYQEYRNIIKKNVTKFLGYKCKSLDENFIDDNSSIDNVCNGTEVKKKLWEEINVILSEGSIAAADFFA